MKITSLWISNRQNNTEMKTIEEWKDHFSYCPSQCYLKVEFMGRRFFIYLRWRWQDPWKAYLCECGPEWDINDSGYEWILLPVDSYTHDDIEKAKKSAIKEAKQYLTKSPVVEQKQEPQDDWTLSRVKMPDFDGLYYVYGFMHHSCGNVTPFHKIVECKLNQWVKSDVGEQMTYWRKLLQPPTIENHEH